MMQSPKMRPSKSDDIVETGGGNCKPNPHSNVEPGVENLAERQDSRDGIGYRKPPRAHQWTKGRSGNPAGRKKGSKNKKTIIVRLMEQKLGRKIEDLSKLTRYEALLLKGIQKALTGDTKAMAFILRRYDDAADAHAATLNTASERDEVVYSALIDKIKRELREAH